MKGLNGLGMNQRRIYLIKRFRGIVNVNGQITSFEFDFAMFHLENETHKFKEVMPYRDSFWKEAVNSMIDSILSNRT